MAESKLLTTDETAEYLRTNVDTLTYWRGHDVGPAFIKVGRRVMYALEDLDKYIAENRQVRGGVVAGDTEDPPTLPVAGRPDDH